MKLVEVTWMDHMFDEGRYRPSKGLILFTSVGYLVFSSDEVLVLAQSYSDGEYHECLHLMQSCVTDIRRLTGSLV